MEVPASPSAPQGVHSDAMVVAPTPGLDAFDEYGVNAYGIAEVVINDRHTLYMMPNCKCGINKPAFHKWVESQPDLACPVCSSAFVTLPRPQSAAQPAAQPAPEPKPSGEGHSLTDRLTISSDGKAVRARPDQIPPFKPTPVPDRDYIIPDQFVRGKNGQLHTRINEEKWKELQKLPKNERKKAIAKIHHADNRARREAFGDDRPNPPKKRKRDQA